MLELSVSIIITIPNREINLSKELFKLIFIYYSMSQIRITCIRKDGGNHQNPHEGITHYGWIDQRGETKISDRQSMVNWIEKGNQAYVQYISGNKAYCSVRTNTATGRSFLQTHSDGNYNNNLLSLPEC